MTASFFTDLINKVSDPYRQMGIIATELDKLRVIITDAPGTLDTLKELADAINDDPSFWSTITSSLSGKENVGVAAGLLSTHLSTFVHADIAHANRSALDLVSGMNTGDQHPASFMSPSFHSHRITKYPKYQRNPAVYKDSSGVLWLWYVRCKTYISRTEGDVDSQYYDVYSQRSVDGGVTWDEPVVFSETLPVTFSPREISFMQDGSNVYHLFISNGCSGSPSDDRLMHHFSSVDGRTNWTDLNPVVIPTWASNPAQIGHAEVIFADSKFHMAFQQRSNSSVYYTNSLDGVTWTTYVTIHATTYMIPKILFEAGTPNKIYVISTKGTHINLAISIDGGATFTNTDIIAKAGSWDPDMSFLPNGDRIIVCAPSFGADGQKLEYSTCPVASDPSLSGSWTTPVALTTGKEGDYEYWDYWPIIYTDGNNTWIFYASEKDLAGRDYQPGQIFMLKFNGMPFLSKNSISGTFTTNDGKTITVVDGQITSIV